MYQYLKKLYYLRFAVRSRAVPSGLTLGSSLTAGLSHDLITLT